MNDARLRAIALGVGVGIAAIAVLVFASSRRRRKQKTYSLAAAKAAAPQPMRKSSVKAVDMGRLVEDASISEIMLHELTSLRSIFPSADIRNDRFLHCHS